MLDPNINSGWRDYSLRPSFGNLREWLFYTWIYTGSDAMFKEGLRRFNEFGLDINHYLRLDPALKGYSMLYQDTEKVYYSMDDARRRRLAEKYGIEYFVMKTSKISQMPNLKKAYENDDFIIFEAKPVSAPGRVDQATEGKR